MKYKVYIFGEDHTTKERDKIEKQIIRLLPKFILSEELGSHAYFSRTEMRKGMRKKVYSISDRTFKLGLHLNVPVIGIDIWDKLPTNTKDQFKVREKYMVETIEKYRKKGIVAVIVGDTHLRTKRTAELGPMFPINKIPNTKIKRSDNPEIE